MILISAIVIVIIYILLKKIQILRNDYNNLFKEYEYEKHLRHIRESNCNEHKKNKLRIEKSEVELDKNLGLLIDDALEDIENRGEISIYLPKDLKDIKCFNKYCRIARIETENHLFRENCISIERLCVSDEYRNKYIGTFLINRVIEWAKLRNKDSIYLHACGSSDKKSGAPLEEFYRKCGFEDTKEGKYNMVLHLK